MLGVHGLRPTLPLNEALKQLCRDEATLTQRVCKNAAFMLLGFDPEQLNAVNINSNAVTLPPSWLPLYSLLLPDCMEYRRSHLLLRPASRVHAVSHVRGIPETADRYVMRHLTYLLTTRCVRPQLSQNVEEGRNLCTMITLSQ